MDASDLDILVQQVQGGDKAAFLELLRTVHKEVRIFLSAHASSIDMVDEVLQATFVACYENLHKYQPRETFLPWLKGIARNLLLKELKERSRYVAVEGDVLEEMLVGRSLASLQETASEAEETGRRLQECLAKLEPPARQLIDKRYMERLSIGQLAKGLQRSESWVSVRLFRIRQALRLCMLHGESPA